MILTISMVFYTIRGVHSMYTVKLSELSTDIPTIVETLKSLIIEHTHIKLIIDTDTTPEALYSIFFNLIESTGYKISSENIFRIIDVEGIDPDTLKSIHSKLLDMEIKHYVTLLKLKDE